MPSLSEIRRYPVKSCRGESLQSAEVEPWGLAGDRRWMLIDAAGSLITARAVNRMLLVNPEITAAGLRIDAPGHAPIAVDTPYDGEPVPIPSFRGQVVAAAAGAPADRWFSDLLGVEARLVWLSDPTQRPTNPDFSTPDDRVSFADAYPLLITTEESLAALNDTVLERSQGQHQPLEMTRFRPNVVLTGTEAWAEDDWRRIRIGEATFRAVKGCNRCVMTTVDPDTAERGKEPIASLAATRRWDGQTWFGVNLIPDLPGATIRVGDEVEILESVEPGAGPVRPAL